MNIPSDFPNVVNVVREEKRTDWDSPCCDGKKRKEKTVKVRPEIWLNSVSGLGGLDPNGGFMMIKYAPIRNLTINTPDPEDGDKNKETTYSATIKIDEIHLPEGGEMEGSDNSELEEAFEKAAEASGIDTGKPKKSKAKAVVEEDIEDDDED